MTSRVQPGSGPGSSVHWLTVTGWGSADDAADAVGPLFGSGATGGRSGWVDQGGGARRFGSVHVLPGTTVTLYSDPVVGDGQDEAAGGEGYWSLDVRGEDCEQIGVAGVCGLLRALRDRGVVLRASRLDLATDLPPGHPATPAAMNAAVLDGNVRTRAHVAEVGGESRRWQESGPRGATTHTLYLGTPRSDRLLRAYDRRGYTRVELQLRHARADRVMQLLELVPIGELAVGAVRDFVDFVDAGSDSNRSRQELLPWWAAFVADVPALVLPIPRPAPSLTRALAWYERAVAPTVAAMRAGMGEAAAAERLRRMERAARLGPRQRAIVREAQLARSSSAA